MNTRKLDLANGKKFLNILPWLIVSLLVFGLGISCYFNHQTITELQKNVDYYQGGMEKCQAENRDQADRLKNNSETLSEIESNLYNLWLELHYGQNYTTSHEERFIDLINGLSTLP